MSLSEFDVGVDENGAQSLLDQLKSEVIDDLKTKLQEGLQPIFSVIDSAWVGEDRDIYKSNVQKTIDNVCNALDQVHSEFQREITSINDQMREFRQTHVTEQTY